jgi:two-component system NtrC family response regulator
MSDADVLRLVVNRAFYIWGLEEQNLALIRAQSLQPLAGVIATSDSMTKVCRTIEKVAPTMATTSATLITSRNACPRKCPSACP